MDIYQKSLQLHKQMQGKIDIKTKRQIDTKECLSLLYSPGVAQPCLEIQKCPDHAYDYTIKANTVAVVSNGSAVLGLGNIGALASIPVMEGKAALFKSFAGVNAFPICLDTEDPDEIIRAVEMMAPVFGGINLEDIKAPECFYIESELKKRLSIPVFHDDQHGTAIVVLAGLINALKYTNKSVSDVHIVMNGMGAAGCAITQLLIDYGFRHFTLCDRIGIIFEGVLTSSETLIEDIKSFKLANVSFGSLADALVNKDVFVGVSAPDIVSTEMVASMNKNAIIFALANPNPEISVDKALAGGASIVATGRSDFANQVNNVLVFPGLFKGVLACRATQISQAMKLEAAQALASLVSIDEMSSEYILPNPFDTRVVDTISNAVIDFVSRN